jgi:5-hydroxyisourate hydrolase
MSSPITTHVLDISRGIPARHLRVVLEAQNADGSWSDLGHGATNADGRISDLLTGALAAGVHRLTFFTGEYFASIGEKGFYPIVQVSFEIREIGGHYHVPLLLSPYGYSTYRGS